MFDLTNFYWIFIGIFFVFERKNFAPVFLDVGFSVMFFSNIR